LSFESQDATHTLGSLRVYIHGIHTRWDPKVCVASCDSNDKNMPEDD